METGGRQEARLATRLRVTACIGLLPWLAISVLCGYTAQAALSYRAGPNDIAAHGMVPADLQTNLIGAALLFPAVIGGVFSLVALLLIGRGVRWALYVACLPLALLAAACVGFLRSPWPVGPAWPGSLFVGSLLVVGSGLADLLRSRLEGLGAGRRWPTLRSLLPVVVLTLAAAPLLVYSIVKNERARDAEQQAKQAREQAEQQRHTRELAEQQRREAESQARRQQQLQAQLDAQSKPSWNLEASPVVDLTLDLLGMRAATVHQDGTIVLWRSALAPGMAQPGGPSNPNRRERAYGPAAGTERVQFGLLGVVSQNGSQLSHWGPEGQHALRHCAERAPKALFEPLGPRRLAVAGSSLCLLELGSERPPSALSVPHCPRITGLHSSSDGALLLVECAGRVVVFDTTTRKLLWQLATEQFLPGSVRWLGAGYAGIARDKAEYVAVLGSVQASVPLRRVRLGVSTVPPQLERLGMGRFVVAGAGVCVYGPGERVDCPVPREQAVAKLAVPSSLSHFSATVRDPSNFAAADERFAHGLVLFARDHDRVAPLALSGLGPQRN